MKSIRFVPLVAVAAFWSLGAIAATEVPCPLAPPADADSRQFWIMPNSDGSGAPDCYLFGDGNGAAGNSFDQVLASDSTLVFLDKANGNLTADTSGAADGALIVSGQGTESGGRKRGTFYVDPGKLAGYADFYIAFSAGNDKDISPRWAAFEFFNIAECTAADPCDWSTAPTLSGGLSHATLYGRVSAVPVPAAVWLLGSGLVGLFGVGRRRKTAVVAA